MREGRGLADLLALAAIVLFVASGALAIGVFLFEQYLGASERSKLEQLDRAKAAFEPSLIAELTRLSDRMNAAGGILGAHIAPSAFFHMLEQTTIANIGFSSLSLAPADKQHIPITMEGLAQSVNSIALQADLFSKGGIVTSPIFSNINRQADGVHFSLTALLDPGAMNYAQLSQAARAELSPPALPPATIDPSPFATPAAPPPAPLPPPNPAPSEQGLD